MGELLRVVHCYGWGEVGKGKVHYYYYRSLGFVFDVPFRGWGTMRVFYEYNIIHCNIHVKYQRSIYIFFNNAR